MKTVKARMNIYFFYSVTYLLIRGAAFMNSLFLKEATSVSCSSDIMCEQFMCFGNIETLDVWLACQIELYSNQALSGFN